MMHSKYLMDITVQMGHTNNRKVEHTVLPNSLVLRFLFSVIVKRSRIDVSEFDVLSF